MLKLHATLYRRLLILLDAFIVTLFFFVSYFIRNHFDGIYPITRYLWILPVTVVLWGLLLYTSGMYVSFRFKKLREIVFIVFRSGFISFLIFTSIGFLTQTIYISRSFILFLFIITSFALLIEKIALIIMFRELRRRGFNFRNILLVGSGPRAKRFIDEMNQSKEIGLKLVGLVDIDPILLQREVHGYRVIGTIKDIPQIIEAHSVDIVVFVIPRNWLKPSVYR